MRKATDYILMGLLLLPLMAIVYLALVSRWTYPQLWDTSFSFVQWMARVSSAGSILKGLWLSIFLALGMGISATGVGFILSGQIAYHRGKSRFIHFAYYPYLIAPVVLGAMLQFYFVRLGLIGTLAGVMLAQFIFILPYAVLLLFTFWNDRIRQTAFQATTLGATSLQVFRTILFPMAKPWLIICFLQCFLISWFEYGITQMIGVGKVPTLTIQTMIYIKEANPHLAALAACMLVGPLVAMLLVNRKLFLKSEDTP